MEVARNSSKRKQLLSSAAFPLNELNQDLLERVASFLPTSSFLRSTSVSKKWKSMAHSPTFTLACSQVLTRDPCFFMVDDSHFITRPVIFDSSQNNWKNLTPLPFPKQSNHHSCNASFMPVASSGGLICFHNTTGQFLVTNPVTRHTQHLQSLGPVHLPVHAIGMFSSSDTFKLVVVSGDVSNSKLTFQNYNANDEKWEPEVRLDRKVESESESELEHESESPQYFLTKCGDVVSTDTQRSPCKQFSSLLTVNKQNQQVLYFLSPSGTIVCCNLSQRSFFEYPRLLPASCEYSIDIVELDGELCVVLLLDFFECASLRVWRWDDKGKCWSQIAKMPDWMSHKFYGKKVDVNCSGAGKQMMVCLNSSEVCSYVLCSLSTGEWVELPEFNDNGEARQFVCGYSFEPRIEASIRRASSDKQRTKAGLLQHSVSSPLPVIHSPRAAPVKGEASKLSTGGKLQILKPVREKNGVTSAVKDSSTSANGSKVVNSTVAPAPPVSGSTVTRAPLTVLEKRPTSQAKSRNDFFNLVRKKSLANSSSIPDSVTANSPSVVDTKVSPSSSDKPTQIEADLAPITPRGTDSPLNTNPSGHLSDRGNLTCNGDTEKNGCNANKYPSHDPILPEEEETAFLRSLGWEENADEDVLTEEEITAFYRDVAKYLNSKPSLKILLQGVQLKFQLPFESQMGAAAIGGVSSGLSSSKAKLES